MHLHILGICGTFMGGIARLAVEKGFKVTGSDQNCYPPMSTQLELLGIELYQGYDAQQLKNQADCVVVGNALSRGTAVIESLLNSNQVYRSGPQWLNENILQDKWVIAVAGTHGKTSTASMIAWILEVTGYNPSFLIGGVMENFGVSARYTDSPFFVVEADEYDSAFFDKRSKFVHYRARTCILNNLEFDHADIFKDLEAIETQFHHLVRTIPEQGLIIRPAQSEPLDRVLNKGCWTETQSFSAEESNQNSEWRAKSLIADGSEFEVYLKNTLVGCVKWSLIGEHNVNNALAAIAAAHHVGVTVKDAINALTSFKNVKRRMELKGEVNDIRIYDDFAHHPTAIMTTLNGLRAKVGSSRIIAVVDPRSNTMKMGVHRDTLLSSVAQADIAIFHLPESFGWSLTSDNRASDYSASDYSASDNSEIEKQQNYSFNSPENIVEHLARISEPGDTILIMSNGGFGDIHQKLIAALKVKWEH